MQIRCIDFIEKMEQWAPLSYAEEWDNCGLHVGRQDKMIGKVLVALTPGAGAIAAAEAMGADMLLTHHPLLFSPVAQINDSTDMGANLIRLIQKDMNVYCAHTNLDITDGGVNDVLAQALELEETAPLADVVTDADGNVRGIGRIGMLKEPVTFGEFLSRTGKAIGSSHLAYTGDVNRMVQKVALCGGSGVSYMKEAKKAGADVYVTGDLKYHNAQSAEEMDLCVVDGGHFGTEHLIVEKLAEFVRSLGPEAVIYEEEDYIRHWNV